MFMNRWKRHHFESQESIVTFLCAGTYVKAGQEEIVKQRRVLESYIRNVPEFRSTHVPFHPEDDAPDLIRHMAVQSEKAGVGPMASVAGTLASEALNAMLRAGARETIVDNGGDMALFIRQPVRVGLFAGYDFLNELAMELEPRDEPFGICTSSGVVGPSHSYGKANAAMVISSNITLADAAATALGNRIRKMEDLETCFDFLEPIPEIEGALAVIQDRIALWGSLPGLVRSPVDTDLITRGRKKVNGER
jgi:ApbE superfamily uncharacterized protein (UPF0280 family)